MDELTAKWDDAKGHPVYGGNVVSDDGAAVKSAVTFLENDNIYGVSRGKSYNYILDMQLPKSIDKFSAYGFVDTIPYEVTVNSWTMYAQIDGQLTALLQAVDPNGNDSKSSSDGLSQPKGDYDSERTKTRLPIRLPCVIRRTRRPWVGNYTRRTSTVTHCVGLVSIWGVW